MLGRLIRWLLALLGLGESPGDLISLRAEYVAGNVRLNWVLPSVGGRQAALDHVLIEGRVVADPELPFTALNEVPVTETTLLLEQVSPGEWEYQGTVFDTNGAKSQNPKRVLITVPFDGPGDLGEFTATLE
jgi:hypothetical protein